MKHQLYSFFATSINFQIKELYIYRKHHQEFIPNKEGVPMKDIVNYEIPFSVIGNIVHRIFIKKLAEIFNFSYHAIKKVFHSNKKTRWIL